MNKHACAQVDYWLHGYKTFYRFVFVKAKILLRLRVKVVYEFNWLTSQVHPVS